MPHPSCSCRRLPDKLSNIIQEEAYCPFNSSVLNLPVCVLPHEKWDPSPSRSWSVNTDASNISFSYLNISIFSIAQQSSKNALTSANIHSIIWLPWAITSSQNKLPSSSLPYYSWPHFPSLSFNVIIVTHVMLFMGTTSWCSWHSHIQNIFGCNPNLC